MLTPEVEPVPRMGRALSLRARLLSGIFVVVVVLWLAILVIFVTSKNRLVNQLDDQLEAATAVDRIRPFQGLLAADLIDARGPSRPERFSQLYEGVLVDGELVTLFTPNLPGEEFSAPEIDSADLVLEAGQQVFFTAEGIEGDVGYRVLATSTAFGVSVRALPLKNVDDASRQMIWVLAASAAAVLAVLGSVIWWVIHLGVRPIKEMTNAATLIAAGDLSVRVDAAAPIGTEAGDLAVALNQMLAIIENSTNERVASEERLRRFVADASHELRTPLTTILGYAELYERGGLNESAALDDAMRRTEAEASRMRRLVGEMLVLAELDRKRIPEMVDVDLSVVLIDAVADARATDPARAIESAIDPGLFVLGDDDRLRQAVANVVANALIHTPSTSRLRIHASEHNGKVRVHVIDDGPGMDSAVAERITERFFRADSSRSRADGGGSGLGMSIVDGVIRQHGGSVLVESASNVGTSVAIVLPVAPEPDVTV